MNSVGIESSWALTIVTLVKSWPCRYHTHAERLRYPCIGVGGVSGGCLEAAIDQVQRHLCAMKQEPFKVTAVKREYIGDAGLLQRAGEQFATGYWGGGVPGRHDLILVGRNRRKMASATICASG